MRLDGRTALITGAARGIGLAIAGRFAAEGARVVLTDIAEPEDRTLVEHSPGRASFLRMDVTDADQVTDAVARVVAETGRIDILVNNAGIEFYEPVTTTAEQQWDALMAVNLKGVFLCSRAVIPHMTAGGSIVNVASELGVVGEANVAAYAASKGGVIALTRAMAIDHAAAGIRVNALSPGPVATELMQSVFDASGDPDGMLRGFQERILLGRMGRPDEVADAAVFLAGDESSFMTGGNLILDGGWTAR